jgi:hypothetical protein
MELEESREEILRKMQDLPADWWQTANAADALIKWFRRNIIGLLIAGLSDGEFQYSVYTGFLLLHEGKLLWLTAGHVVDEIESILYSENFEPSMICWLDDYGVQAANSVIVHRKDMAMRSWKQESLDFGIIVPSILDAGNLLSNNKVNVIEESIWRNLDQAVPEGYYAIGYPGPCTRHSPKRVSEKQILHSIEADLAILPVMEIPAPKDLSVSVSWSDEKAFYCKILPFKDLPGFDVEEIKGMSGGPILSVERDSNGRIKYRLIGIIQSWFRSESIIRAEPIGRIADAISSWLD